MTVRGRVLPGSQLVLAAAGSVAAFIGSSLLWDPRAFYAGYALDVGNDVSLGSEFRGTAGMLLAVAATLFVGAFRPQQRPAAALIGAVTYVGYAAGRAVSALVDGAPHRGLVYAAVTELLLGVACAWSYRSLSAAAPTAS